MKHVLFFSLVLLAQVVQAQQVQVMDNIQTSDIVGRYILRGDRGGLEGEEDFTKLMFEKDGTGILQAEKDKTVKFVWKLYKGLVIMWIDKPAELYQEVHYYTWLIYFVSKNDKGFDCELEAIFNKKIKIKAIKF